MLTLKQSEHDRLDQVALISHIVTVVATRNAVLNMAPDHTRLPQQQMQPASRPHDTFQQNSHCSRHQRNQVHPTNSGSGYGGAALMDLDCTCLILSTHKCESRQREGLCRRCRGASHFAKDCRAPPLKQKLLPLKQQGYVFGEVRDKTQNDAGASASKEVLALPAP